MPAELRYFPNILSHEERGAQTTELYEEALRLLDDIITNNRVRLRAVLGLWPANSVGDDVEVYTDTSRTTVETFVSLREQHENKDGLCPCLADFWAPAAVLLTMLVGSV